MAQLKVTQIRSAIGTKPNQRQTLRSLGLKRIDDSVVQEDPRDGRDGAAPGHRRGDRPSYGREGTLT